jgi:transcriptional regulator with XRE-family HTH domain
LIPLEVLGSRIRAARRERGLTQVMLAARVDVTDQAVSLFELGRAMPSLPTLVDIAATLEVPLASLVEPARDPRDSLRRKAQMLLWRLDPERLAQAVAFLEEFAKKPE